MEIVNTPVSEVRGLNAKELRELELDVRKELALIRMDVNMHGAQRGKVKGLKKTLARALTVRAAAGLTPKTIRKK